MAAESKVLLSSEKKRALEICIEHGLASSEFSWEETFLVQDPDDPGTAPLVSKLVHIPTGYYFWFDFYPEGDHFDSYSPAKSSLKYERRHKSPKTRLENVAKWAQYLVREVEAEDFVTSAMASLPIEQYALISQDNRPFTDSEHAELLEKLGNIEAHVLELRKFQETDAAHVRQQFAHLRAEAKHTGRLSWFQMTVGVLVSIVAAFFDNDVGRQIWHFVNDQFSSLLRISE